MLELRKEDIFIFFDLTTDFLKKKAIFKGIKEFIEKKKELNILSSFNVLLFIENAIPVLLIDKTSPGDIIDMLSGNWEKRYNDSLFENGMFLTLSEILKKARKGVANYRIIVITDSPSEIPEEMQEPLFNLVGKVKILPTFIDIIRVGNKKFYADDVKLKIITLDTMGGMFYADSADYFIKILSTLSKNKEIQNIIVGEEKKQIQPEDKPFYEKLASDLISPESNEKLICTICNMPICPICLKKEDIPYKCFNCNAAYHDCCAAQYSSIKNIGFIHIFRCANCGTLLKLNEDLVKNTVKNIDQLKVLDVDVETIEKEREELKEIPLSSDSEEFTTIPSEEDFSEEEKKDLIIIESETSKTFKDILPSEPHPPPRFKKTKIRPGGFFGPEIEIGEKPIPPKEVDSPNYWTPKKSTPSNVDSVRSIEEQKITSITQLKPPKKRATLRFCKICGSPIKGKENICRSCGSPI